jgi:hypothetical protein
LFVCFKFRSAGVSSWSLQDAFREAEERCLRKQTIIADLTAQEAVLMRLADRNVASVATPESRIFMPFIVINTRYGIMLLRVVLEDQHSKNCSESTAIDCLMTEDRTEIFFDFDQPFEVQDDSEVLRRLLDQDNVPAASASSASAMQSPRSFRMGASRSGAPGSASPLPSPAGGVLPATPVKGESARPLFT